MEEALFLIIFNGISILLENFKLRKQLEIFCLSVVQTTSFVKLINAEDNNVVRRTKIWEQLP